jgi:hypothetical protein
MNEGMQTRTELLERYWVSYVEVRIVTNIVNVVSFANDKQGYSGYTLVHVADAII